MNLKFLHGDKSRISTDITPFDEGSFYVTHDGDMYVDMNTGTNSEPYNQRVQLTFNADIVRSEIISAIYPIGSIYASITDTDPATLFGVGTWERIEDCFLLAAGSKHSAGESGGEESVTLTVDQMPSHSHSASTSGAGGHSHQIGTDKDTIYSTSGQCWSVHNASSGYTYMNGSTSWVGNHTHGVTVNNTGGNGSHNNMPPYLAVYVWKRIS